MLSLLQFLLGAFIVGCALYDVFQSVVVPRWSSRTLRLSAFMFRHFWPLYRKIGLNSRSPEQRETILGTYAPLALVLLLALWVASLILGYGLMLHALANQIRPPIASWSESFYVAGTAIMTLGFGDFVAVHLLGRIVMLSAAASGLAVVALMISFTFSLFASFTRREVRVLTLDARAGAPPSGVTLLETYAQLKIMDDLPEFFNQWELWSAEVLESHIAYPILAFFRSSHDNESWISALGAVLDAATLLLTTTEECDENCPQGAARLMYGLGVHAVVDLGHYFRAGDGQNQNPGVERGEFEAARARLQKAGWKIKTDKEAWREFTSLRTAYAGPLNALARQFATPPSQWIGDRSPLPHLQHHVAHFEEAEEQAAPEAAETVRT